MKEGEDFTTRSGASIPQDWVSNAISKIEKQIGSDSKGIRIDDNSVAFGIWMVVVTNNKAKLSIYRQGLINTLAAIGFYKILQGNELCFLREQDGFIELVEPLQIGHVVFQVISQSGDLKTEKTFKKEFSFSVFKLQETWLRQFELTIKATVLSYMETYPKPILNDTAFCKFLPFKNLLIEITKVGVRVIKYGSKDAGFGVWKSQLINHEIYLDQISKDESQFYDFLWNVCNQDAARLNAFKSAIGYLCHNFQTNTQNQAVICVDEAITTLDKPEGGTGKGLLIQAIKQICSLVTVDGKAFQSNNRFAFQDVQVDTQVVALEDIKRTFDFDRLNSVLTEGLTIEKKNQDAFKFSKSSSPKIVITSNVMVDSAGNTRKRRQFIIEFGDYLKSVPAEHLSDPINYLYKCNGFFTDAWSKQEWDYFYNFMISCIQYYLINGLKSYEHKNLKLNQLIQHTSQEFAEWLDDWQLQIKTEYITKELYNDFMTAFNMDENEVKQRQFTCWVKYYAEQNELVYKNRSTNGKTFFILKPKQH